MDDDLQRLLLHVSEDLWVRDVQAMVFLCGDNLRTADKEHIRDDGKTLFSVLQKKDLLSQGNLSFLKEILWRIGRIDILKNQLKLPAQEIADLPNTARRISPYRCLLYDISERLSTSDVDKVKYLLYPGPHRTESMLDVLLEMEKDGKLSEDDLKTLSNALREIHRNDLLQKVASYERQQGCQAASLISTLENLGIEESSPETQKDSSVPQGHMEEYRLEKVPHGWCVIINNKRFSDGDRSGTDRDAEAIRKVFAARGYVVEEHKDLTGDGILHIMEEYQKKDHSERDSFVCFVLSHGGQGVVFGTDGKEVPIKNITNCVNGQNCESLRGKPKVFFLQACQGDQVDEGVPYHSDSIGSTYADDGTRGHIPTNADFLTGFATVEDYISLRHPRNGSVYVQKLCIALTDHHYFQEDLASILTTVHQRIAEEDYDYTQEDGRKRVKQMPSYKSELRKRLILPPPSNEGEIS
ncbi:caspase-8-like [Pseudophryne corroboree]|uniref:caspase-8-like n=1 Tax=Pseudophryne corroboree TaxID=495146 RepID=UPI003081A1FE